MKLVYKCQSKGTIHVEDADDHNMALGDEFIGYVLEIPDEGDKTAKINVYEEMAIAMIDAFNTFKRKHKSYGSDNIGQLGERAVFVRMFDKIQRLKQLVWLGKENPLPEEDESVYDTYQDLGVYAFIALLVRKRFWPKY